MNGTLTKESSFVKNRAKLFSPSKSEEDTLDCNAERKKPSYVNLSCAVSGYSGLNRYDSKARQEIRSRESSRDRLPLCLTRSRDSSPSPTKPFPEHLSSASSRRSIGLILSLENSPISGVSPVMLTSHNTPTTGQRSKSVDRGFLRQNFLNGYLNASGKPPSGISSSSSMGVNSTFSNTSATSTVVTSSSCHKSTENVTTKATSSSSDDPSATRGRLRIRNSTVASSSAVHERLSQQQQDSSSNKSFIQQRIERLYGPAALARGFFTVKTSPHKGESNSKATLQSISLNNNNNEQSVDEVEATTNRTRARTTDGTCSDAQQPPVFRHLNAEFRQQLQLKKSRSRSIENRLDEPVLSPKSSASIDPQSTSGQDSEMTVVAAVAVSSAAAGGSNESGCCSNGDVVVLNGPRTPTSDPEQQSLAGHRFLRILDDERQRLNRLIVGAEGYLTEPSVISSEELTGKIRAAIGKCKLLLAQKFEQFAGLCRKNLTQNSDEPFPTTGEDLAGFWDMVNIQVEHINSLFDEIHALQRNGWTEVIVQTTASSGSNNKAAKKSNRNTSSTKTSVASAPRSAKAEEAAKAREEARRKMMEDRKRMMKAKKSEDWVITEKPEANGDAEADRPQKTADGDIIV